MEAIFGALAENLFDAEYVSSSVEDFIEPMAGVEKLIVSSLEELGEIIADLVAQGFEVSVVKIIGVGLAGLLGGGLIVYISVTRRPQTAGA